MRTTIVLAATGSTPKKFTTNRGVWIFRYCVMLENLLKRKRVTMRCLVTGVAGFVGSHLAERLLADGHEVCGIDAFLDYYPRQIKEKNLLGARAWDRFTFLEGDLLRLDLPSIVEGVDWIFHQAAQAGVRASWGQEFSRYVDCNVLATQRLLEAVVHVKGLQRFVYASSSSVYGNARRLPVEESDLPQPISPYGVTKLAAEHLCTLYHTISACRRYRYGTLRSMDRVSDRIWPFTAFADRS